MSPRHRPVSMDGLVASEYQLVGEGHVVSAYSGPQARRFTHRRLDH